MKVTIENPQEKAILKLLFNSYDKCEECGEKMSDDDANWYTIETMRTIHGGMAELTCPKCGHVHVETFSSDYLPTVENALAREAMGDTKTTAPKVIKPTVAQKPVVRQTKKPSRPSSVADAAMDRLRRKAGK